MNLESEMLDILDTLIVRDLVASLPPRERKLANLLMAGHTQTSAAHELRITVRSARYRLAHIRQRFSLDSASYWTHNAQ